MRTKLLVLTASSCLSRWIPENIPSGSEVIFTNVQYPPDQEEMNRLLSNKKGLYPKDCTFHFNPRNPFPLLFNLSGDVGVLDNLNLWVSNTMLLYNFEGVGETDAYYDIVRSLDESFSQYIGKESPNSLLLKTLYIITSDVDFDWNVQTSYGRLYQRLIARYNAKMAEVCSEVSILFHNRELKIKC